MQIQDRSSPSAVPRHPTTTATHNLLHLHSLIRKIPWTPTLAHNELHPVPKHLPQLIAHSLHKYRRNQSKHSMTSCPKNLILESTQRNHALSIPTPPTIPRHSTNSNDNCLHHHHMIQTKQPTYMMISMNLLMIPTKTSLIPLRRLKPPLCPISHCQCPYLN